MSLTTPRVSVIVPNYNHARFIEQRMESVLQQTYQDFELLYLDDASTDHSAAVVEKYRAHPKVRMILNTQNSGSPFKQWNKGVREAQGEFVWIAEADDFADEHLLERLVPLLEQNPTLGLAYAQSWAVDEQGERLFSYTVYTRDLDPHRWDHSFIAEGRLECSRYFSRKNTVPNASAALFRRAHYEQVGGAEEGFRFCGDWLLWARLVAVGGVAFVGEHLNYFRSHSGSVTHHATRSSLEMAEAYTVLHRLIAQGLVEPADQERACERMLERWLDLEGKVGGLPWRRRLELYRLARRCDAHLPGRLWRQIRRRTMARLRRPRPTSTEPLIAAS